MQVVMIDNDDGDNGNDDGDGTDDDDDRGP